MLGGNWNAATAKDGLGEDADVLRHAARGRAARRWRSARRACRCTSPRRRSSRTSRPRTSTSSPARAPVEALVDTQQVPAATDGTAEPSDQLGKEVKEGWDQLVEDGGLTLYPDWSSPTMLATMGQSFQEMLAGRDAPRRTSISRTQDDWEKYHERRCSGELRRRAGPSSNAGCARAHPASRGGSRTCTSLPAFAFYLLFAFGPLVYTAWLSFFDWDGLTVGTWIGLDNYNEVLSDPGIRASFVHSFELIIFYAVLPVRPRAWCSRR